MPTGIEFTQQVGEAFKSAGSLLALARSPLAVAGIIGPALVLDELSPTADERGLALRQALQWAVEQVGPEAAKLPFGVERPLDDPTWRDLRWRRYNVLRHLYLEPLPVDGSAAGRRSVERILSLTGIVGMDSLIEERDRALRDASAWLRRQLLTGVGNERISEIALEAVWQPLTSQRPAVTLLGIASVFSGVFPLKSLMELAIEENVRYPERALEMLVARRCLQAGDAGQSLWIPPALRAYVHARQAADLQRRRHLLAARSARMEQRLTESARQLIDGGMQQQAANVILAMSDEQHAESAAELLELLERFQQGQVAASQWRDLHVLYSDLLQRAFRTEDAIAAAREALQVAHDPIDQALIYRRLGKLHEDLSPVQASAYYQLALDRLPPDDPELAALFKDRAWLHVLLQEWEGAEQDLKRATLSHHADDQELRADIYEVYSSLRRGQGEYAEAVDYAQRALALREQAGDLMRVGKAYNTLGILYRMKGEYSNAITAYGEAQNLFASVGNESMSATALLNIGTAHHFAEQMTGAEQYYRRALEMADELGLDMTVVRARANLSEALMNLQREEEARLHWRAAYGLSVQSGFDDEIVHLRELCERYPGLECELTRMELAADVRSRADADGGRGEGDRRTEDGLAAHQVSAAFDSDEAAALALAEASGRVSAAALMAAAQVSKATATRKLARLSDEGLLVRHGHGRSTYYTRAHRVPVAVVEGDLAGLQARLDGLLARFSASHGVERMQAMSVVRVAGADGEVQVRYDVMVAFRSVPDLAGFFELERELSGATRMSLRLTI